MAKVPEGEDVNTWDPTDAVWFKIYQDSLVSGSSTASWTSDGMYLKKSPFTRLAGNQSNKTNKYPLHRQDDSQRRRPFMPRTR